MMERADERDWIDGGEREWLVRKYHYLCRRGARKYARRSEDRADFEQTAAIGLLKAADRYRAETGTPFEAYAWILIQGELSHYVRDAERMLRPPRRLRSLERRWRDEGDLLRRTLNREPSDDEIAEAMLLEEGALRELREFRERARIESLDALPVESPAHAYDVIEAQIERLALEHAMRALTSLERRILSETFARDRSVGDVAARLGYSERHVSRIRRNAVRKLAQLDVLTGTGGGY